MSLAESTVKPETASPLTIPGIRIRRDEKEREADVCVCVFFLDSEELMNNELFSLLSE